MPELLRDLRLTVRNWGRNPLFVLVAILTLALGIGANTALFTLTNAVLLKHLPVKNPQDLVVVGARDADGFAGEFSYPMYRTLRDANTVFSGVIARYGTNFSVSAGGTAEHVYGEMVTGNYYQVLGVQPYIGRLLDPNDDRVPGGHPVVVLSYGFWQRAFGADRSPIGKEILLNGRPMTVLGVTPPEFYGAEMGANPAVRVPMTMAAVFTQPANRLSSWRHRWITLLARLKPGVSAHQGRAASDVLCHQALEEELAHEPPAAAQRFRKNLGTWHIDFRPGAQGFGRMQRMLAMPLRMLLGVTALVLLITCAKTCCWRAPPNGSRKWPCVSRWGPAVQGSSGNSSPRARCWRWLAAGSAFWRLFGCCQLCCSSCHPTPPSAETCVRTWQPWPSPCSYRW